MVNSFVLRRYVALALGFTVVLNALNLVAPLFMLQIYDRVITSGSYETLTFLTAIALFLMGIYVFAEAGRRRILSLFSDHLGQLWQKRVAQRVIADAGLSEFDRNQAMANLATCERTLMNNTVAPLLDLPFTPFYLLVLFLIHPYIGLLCSLGVLLIGLLAFISDRQTRGALQDTQKLDQHTQLQLNTLIQGRGVIVGLGMANRLLAQWEAKRSSAMEAKLNSAADTGFFAGLGRSARMILQALVLALSALLVMQQQISPGAIVASSIILGRAVAPIDQIIGTLRGLISAQNAWNDLSPHIHALQNTPKTEVTPMHRPDPVLQLEDFTVGDRSKDIKLLPSVSHSFHAGSIVLLVGASGTGKSSWLRTVAGAAAPYEGVVRLGGRDMSGWDPEDRGQYVGYLPQNVSLLNGSVREIIARHTDCAPQLVEDAARLVGCHDVILRLPQGYDTVVSPNHPFLSGGMQQSIGLARALFNNPSLLLLDEPTAHLDSTMRQRFGQWIEGIAKTAQNERSQTIFMATHDHRLVNAADFILVLQSRQVALMTRGEYLKKVMNVHEAVTHG